MATKSANPIKVEITLDEARKLPGMLGVIAPKELEFHGEYRCTVGGERVHYVRNDHA